MICVVYVDDTIIWGSVGGTIEWYILGVEEIKHKQSHKFELLDENEVGDFLSVIIEKKRSGKLHLVQN